MAQISRKSKMFNKALAFAYPRAQRKQTSTRRTGYSREGGSYIVDSGFESDMYGTSLGSSFFQLFHS